MSVNYKSLLIRKGIIMSYIFKHALNLLVLIILCSFSFSQGKDVSRELKRLNAKIDRVRVFS